MNPTANQQRAIVESGNVLVLAGAGSGKTTTLVERCLRHVLDPAAPVNVDQMLVVTFTDAAAAEVRHRLHSRLEGARADAEPDVAARLDRQLALIETAHISTLHSFCLHLVRQHFHELGLDPSIMVLREEHAALLKDLALDQVMERHFSDTGDEGTRVARLIEVCAGGREETVRTLVLKLHNYTQTLVHPERWFQEELARATAEMHPSWPEWLNEALANWSREWGEILAGMPGNFIADRFADRVKSASSRAASEWPAFLAEIIAEGRSPERGLAPQRDELDDFLSQSEFLHSLVKEPGALGQDWGWVREHIATLLQLTRQFSSAYAAMKREQAAVDFHDLEQFALELLIGSERSTPTPIAREWRERFRLIFVDEYQDINAAQDAILRAVARDGNQANRFLVGDVKQSIYRFRLADPAIFQKYKSDWEKPGAAGKVVPLVENFRSAAPILDFVNAIFGELMRREIGGVDYDTDARLTPGDTTRPAPEFPCVEFHLRTNGNLPEANGDDENVTDAELEARLVAQRLREIHDTNRPVWDSQERASRPVKWSDMVVLLRSPRNRAEIYLKEFHNAGIPLQAERGGLFDSSEVSDLLCLLKILDNPLQDVPLLAVLRSPLVGLTLDELACVRAWLRKAQFWTALRRFHEAHRGASGAIREAWDKVDLFLRRFSRWRKMARHCELSERIECVLNETHYLEWLLTQSRPAQRRANVRRFVALAGQFDPIQRQGLQRFLRFVEAQREAETDSEPEALEEMDAVRLMSIHKSKGLEFPIVALANLGGKFNTRELSDFVLLDEQYGVCSHVKPPGCGSSYPSLAHWLGARRQRRQTIGEELRLLYVAMTRARDSLLLFGSASRKTAREKWTAGATGRRIDKANCALDWIGPFVAARVGSDAWGSASDGMTDVFRWHIHEQVLPLAANAAKPAGATTTISSADLAALSGRLEWRYPSVHATQQTAKLSVTALRNHDENASNLRFRPSPSFASRVPSRGPDASRNDLPAAEVGTVHHLFLQLLDLRRSAAVPDLSAQVARMLAEGLLTPEQARCLDLPAVAQFWDSDLAREILAAPEKIHREIPFTARFTRDDLTQAGLTTTIPENEFVIVQGTVDLAVIRADEIWIVDFKTDSVAEKDLGVVVDHYAPQLRLYASALERIYRRPVTKRWLHFFAARRTISVD